jgi:hypothetical protein
MFKKQVPPHKQHLLFMFHALADHYQGPQEAKPAQI